MYVFSLLNYYYTDTNLWNTVAYFWIKLLNRINIEVFMVTVEQFARDHEYWKLLILTR